eukprot:CAMPEP_0181483240 /NCGR_PEP_ID=MMETSP1110-20121109/45314_1 /TAXON_ID=174948 /ORGANISM="Symbiodinium sp., Strain CCMP421" /LENGTH=148 /DNA_ID=CAMNT_0023608935 /DNA_START=268 /DNA_END=714 /DNA_ORIENTATION=+
MPPSTFGFLSAKKTICWQLIFDIIFSMLRRTAPDMSDLPFDDNDKRQWIACKTGKSVSKRPACWARMDSCAKSKSRSCASLMDLTASRCFLSGFMRPLWQQRHQKHSSPSSLVLHDSLLAPVSLDKPGGGPMLSRSSKSGIGLSPAKL